MVSLLAESWTWSSIATVVFLIRCATRTRRVEGILKWQVDDWLMVLALCFYILDIVSLNVVARSESNLLPPGYLQDHKIEPAELSRREYGSKWVLVVEQCQCSTIWLLKCCLLFMYERFTRVTYLVQNVIVRILIVYVILTFAVMETLYFAVWCRPFYMYWAVPTTRQCSAATNHLIVNAVFNLTSDLAILGVTLPLFARSRLPLNEKASLCFIFGLGIFTMVSAVLNKYYSFSNPFGPEWTYWYCREASTAFLVTNLPFVWGLIRTFFRLKSRGMEVETPPVQIAPAKRTLPSCWGLSRPHTSSSIARSPRKGREEFSGFASLQSDDEAASRGQASQEEYELRLATPPAAPEPSAYSERRRRVSSLVENDQGISKEDAKYLGRDDLS